MDFRNLSNVITQPIGIIDASFLKKLSDSNARTIADMVDSMGERSMRAQGLRAILTSISKLKNSDQRLYVYSDGRTAQGILKVGKKGLFILDKKSQIQEIKPLCVLDFYVHEDYQRMGIGKALFESMIAIEGVEPHELGYDRPSDKFLSFLDKHYGLSSYVPQGNNFVVFDEYFTGITKSQTKKTSRSSSRSSSRSKSNNTSKNTSRNTTSRQSQYRSSRSSSRNSGIGYEFFGGESDLEERSTRKTSTKNDDSFDVYGTKNKSSSSSSVTSFSTYNSSYPYSDMDLGSPSSLTLSPEPLDDTYTSSKTSSRYYQPSVTGQGRQSKKTTTTSTIPSFSSSSLGWSPSSPLDFDSDDDVFNDLLKKKNAHKTTSSKSQFFYGGGLDDVENYSPGSKKVESVSSYRKPQKPQRSQTTKFSSTEPSFRTPPSGYNRSLSRTDSGNGNGNGNVQKSFLTTNLW